MKTIFLSLLTILFFTTVSFAQECKTCEPLEKLAKQNFRTTSVSKKGRDALMNFEFSKDGDKKSKEIQSYLKVSLKAVQADNQGISDEYLYNAYLTEKEAFDAEIKKMKPIDKEIILKAIKNTDTSRKTDESK